MHIPVFIKTLVIEAKIWKQSKCMPMGKWVEKFQYGYKLEYYFLAKTALSLQQLG